MRLLPDARSGRWWKLGGLLFIVATLLLWFTRFVVVGQAYSHTHAFRFMMFAALLVLLATLAGWLGARWVWLGTMAGMLAGFVLMVPYANDPGTGWEDLTSLAAFMQAIFYGILAGIVIELAAWGWRRLANRRRT
jgi:hypothetical protein